MDEIFAVPLNPTDARTFTGEAYSALVAAADVDFPVKLYFVRFRPGARTFWHTHSGQQIIVVTSGECRYQVEGGEVTIARAGESVRFPPGVRHWHGAAENQPMEHFAINLDPIRTDWHEEVSL